MTDSPETTDYQQLVEQLYEPRTRRVARQKLVAVVTPRVLARRVENIARRADSIDRILTKTDQR